jgi:hypothetical protein
LELHKIRLLGLSFDQRAMGLGGNALRLLHRYPFGREEPEITRPKAHAHHLRSRSEVVTPDQSPAVPESEYHL